MKTAFFSNPFLAVTFLIGTSISGYSQVQGCTDTLANNYNSTATINNGSCTYNVTSYTPPIKVDPISDTLIESSGLQWAGNALWTFNDGGGSAAIYRIDTLANILQQRVYLEGASNIDWEDIAFDGIYFYVGDFGNNANGARTDLKIYKFPLSAIPPDYIANPVVVISAAQIAVINFTYSDQPQPPQPTNANNTKYDCEAMIIDSGKIHLFSKNWIDLVSTHYVIDGVAAGDYIAQPVEVLVTNYLVTAADKAIGQKLIALLGYQNSGLGNHFIYLLSGYSGGNYFNGNKRLLNLPTAAEMGQAEGLTFKNGVEGYISNEKFMRTVFGFSVLVNQKLRAFDIHTFVSGLSTTYIFTGNGNWDNPANWSGNIMPPATPPANSQIFIDPQPEGQCVLNVSFTLSQGSAITINAGKSFVIQGNLIQQ